jgi:hypothetical protein
VQRASPFKYKKRIPSSFPWGFRLNANITSRMSEPKPLNSPPSKIPKINSNYR